MTLKTNSIASSGFSFFKAKYPTIKVGRDKFAHLNSLKMEFIQNLLLKGDSVALPHNLGLLTIAGKRRPVRIKENGTIALPIDWKRTKEYKKIHGVFKYFYHENIHTDGYIFTLKWSKKKHMSINKNFFSLKPSGDFKKRIADKIKNENASYTRL